MSRWSISFVSALFWIGLGCAAGLYLFDRYREVFTVHQIEADGPGCGQQTCLT